MAYNNVLSFYTSVLTVINSLTPLFLIMERDFVLMHGSSRHSSKRICAILRSGLSSMSKRFFHRKQCVK
uniref:Uncharacterized protein n=1 Tax=Anguilla anguilla TaxID=7936 RepID=A0A0E9WER2_ANGAN